MVFTLYFMSANTVKRRITASVACLWELIRLGLLWQINEGILAAAYGQLNAFYLMWLIAPVLAVIAGYLIAAVEPDSCQVCVLLVMSRGFQVVFGLLAFFSLLFGSLTASGLSAYLLLILLMVILDILFLVVQTTDLIGRNNSDSSQSNQQVDNPAEN